ncbi:DUF262 domain-containing protein [Naumannella sp. ID2617S]|nr:DUF262 domain-containing protein [Naumannella sp. ID2617S]
MTSDQLKGYLTTFAGLFAISEAEDTGRTPIAKIEIPLVQRDYAQGRVNPEVSDIRSSFLESIHDAVAGDGRLSLDFVYGDEHGGTLRPLDGQQRLTTLFLLHWYLTVRSGSAPEHEAWARFSYVVRPSARRFCEQLVKACPPQHVPQMSAWLVDQPWYLFVWRHDPTIQAMLVMLDEIHTMFGGDDAERALARLTDPTDPAISFYVLRLEEVGAGDELYIKMNSRGKPLTEFENFKARFEHVIAHHRPAAQRIAHKFDGPWSDILWPFHGGDNIVDDEFMHYLTFLFEICEWRAGKSGQVRMIHRASRLFGEGVEGAEDNLAFFEAAFDCWQGEDIAGFFSTILKDVDKAHPPDDRAVLFTPDRMGGLNLFEMCSSTYRDMLSGRVRAFPLGLALLLFGVLVHRVERTDDFPRRLRVVRNLVAASENEIRGDSMGALLADVEGFLRSGDLDVITSFNQAQLADERRKAEFLDEHPGARGAVQRLEDHRLLRGTLSAIVLDETSIEAHASAFERVFSDPQTWVDLTGALLASGDYFRRGNEHAFFFGSPSLEAPWRHLLTGTARTSIEATRGPLARVLDAVAAAGDAPLKSIYASLTDAWLRERQDHRQFDWRYLLVRYPSMRYGASGKYVSETDTMGYTLCALKATQLNSYYQDPVVSAIVGESGIPHRGSGPWFSGYQYVPRWFQLPACEVQVRCIEAGLVFHVHEAQRDEAVTGLPPDILISVTPEGFMWTPTQDEIDGELVDRMDRVEVGALLVKNLFERLGPLDPRAMRLAQTEDLSRTIGNALKAQTNLNRSWLYQPSEHEAWVAFQLGDGNCIELVLRAGPQGSDTPLVKAYRTYGKPGRVYEDFDHVPLGVGWDSTDDEIVSAFLEQARLLQERHPRELGSSLPRELGSSLPTGEDIGPDDDA